MRSFLCLRILFLFILILNLTGSLSAQDTSEEGAIDFGALVIEGEKVPREFIDTFSSVGVATSEDIENFKIDDIRDAFNLQSNVRWNEGNRGNAGITIRGINSDGLTGTNNAPVTSVIIDGATQSVEGAKRGSRGIWDVKQIEVFKGPQSTLQGRNALAGAVVIETNDPSYEWEAKVQGTLGQDERKDGAFVLSGPLIDNQVAFRISGEVRDKVEDITYTNPVDAELGQDEYRNIRGKLLIEPSFLPKLSVLLTVSSTFDQPGVTAVNDVDDFFNRKFISGTNSTAEIRQGENDNYVADVTYKINDKLTLHSISSKIDSSLEISSPEGSSFTRTETRDGDDFTQDIRLQIGDAKDKFSGVIGGFYGDFTLPRDSLITVGDVAIQDLKQNNETENRSLYVDFRYRFVPKWSVLAGGRYTDETVRNKLVDTGLLNPTEIDVSEDFEVFLPKIGLAYDINDDQTLAFVAQRGYRSGFAQQTSQGVNVVDPEFLWSYSLAYRAQSPTKNWTFGATAFYYDYTDQQIEALQSIGGAQLGVTVNAGESESYGAEFDGRYNFENGLSVFGSLGLIKTEFKELNTINGDFSGNEFPEAPLVTASFGGLYKHSSGFFVSADASYTGDYFSNSDLANVFEVDSYFIVNARAGYETDKVKAMFFVDNLFDEQYLTSISGSNPQSTTPSEATVGDGLTVGMQYTIKY